MNDHANSMRTLHACLTVIVAILAPLDPRKPQTTKHAGAESWSFHDHAPPRITWRE